MLNVVDLFAGPGGLSLGFEMVKNDKGRNVFKTLKAVEIDPWACKTLRKNFSDDIVIEADIKKNETKELIEKECKRETDLVVAGPPCQSFSLIGPRSGRSGARRGLNPNRYDNLYMDFVEIVERLSPKFFVFENVKGILSKKNGDQRIIDVILSEMKRMGYTCGDGSSYYLLNAADYGVPQTRERVIIIGNNIGINNLAPVKTHFDSQKNVLQRWNSEMLPHVTIRDAIGDLPRIQAKKTLTNIPEENARRIMEYNQRINSGTDNMKYILEWRSAHLKKIGKSGKKFFHYVRPSVSIPLTHHYARPQMESDIKLFAGMEPGTCAKDVIESKDPKISNLSKYIRYDMSSFSDKYKKHSWKTPCSTIFAHLKKDGNRFIHPDGTQARTFTPREAARIQSFPDSFFFEGPMSKKFQQIGNAVPPLLAKIVAESIFISLSK